VLVGVNGCNWMTGLSFHPIQIVFCSFYHGVATRNKVEPHPYLFRCNNKLILQSATLCKAYTLSKVNIVDDDDDGALPHYL